MKSVWLIQRAFFENRENKEGIDSILQFDYMGSSEFEWGALPKALKELRTKINEYVYFDLPIKDHEAKIVTVFCLSSDTQEIIDIINKLALDKFHLQEPSYFPKWIEGAESWCKCDFWWDITNHFMFWKKNSTFETLFKERIKK